ncbi:MAG: bifunctional diaminohydroxyphosphoribosylaminopyrimidine deaminase/5-amino-6-(5-phosphoribosylamino)uracil reductase RibD [Rhodocyclales bacterium]|nr:bifunctional diaminohydroxyphosphoribosylaminopyrimidine deaminase/5-amino-6-(5-phosphoribosylamino)uracil reductase RibD [Rhodocyclales bacterium]
MPFSAADHAFMAHALRLAAQGLNTTAPNPRVGCVVVRDGKLVGEGWHAKAGEPHAEVHALRAAGDLARGATAYVTLEPCSHFGRTPPCADALIAAGVVRVVAAMADPNPLVAGQGMAKLASAGIETAVGLLATEARELNLGFVSRMTRGRPWVRLKAAISLDGRTALNNGVSQWITGPEARSDGHAWRARSCALLTGIGTVRDDDPQLTVRAVATTRQPLRVVVDGWLELRPTARVVEGGNTLVFTAVDDAERAAALRAQGADVICLPDGTGKVDLPGMFGELGRRGVNEVLVEAGARLNGALIRTGCVDELLLYQAPILIGDPARGLAVLPELTDLTGRRELEIVDSRRIGCDMRLLARFK